MSENIETATLLKKDYNKMYYEKNKEKTKARLIVKEECDICGCILQKREMTRHKKSFKCKRFKQKMIDDFNKAEDNKIMDAKIKEEEEKNKNYDWHFDDKQIEKAKASMRECMRKHTEKLTLKDFTATKEFSYFLNILMENDEIDEEKKNRFIVDFIEYAIRQKNM